MRTAPRGSVQSASAEPMASTSSSRSRPHNLLTVFQCHFHVRRGNELTYFYGHDLDLSGVEWKCLPSGSHAIQRDLLWFHLPASESSEQDDGLDESQDTSAEYSKIVVAAFRNRRLDEGGADEAEDQRGARMLAVGVVVACLGSTPSAQLSACLPHVEALQRLSDNSALDPRNYPLLEQFLDSHRFDPSQDTISVLRDAASLRCSGPLSRRPVGSLDPLLDLPAVANALGLLLPQLLRTLLVRGTRLLMFVPLGAETRSAAFIAWALAEMVEAVMTSSDDEEYFHHAGETENAMTDSTLQEDRCRRLRRHRRIPFVRGIIGLQDMGTLQELERERQNLREGGAPSPHGWIAWTTDKLYLEKASLFDCLLDLSPLVGKPTPPTKAVPDSYSALSQCDSALPAASPTFSRVVRPNAKKGGAEGRRRQEPRCQVTAWLPRDFATYRSNERRSVRLASRPRSLARRGSRSSVRYAVSDSGDRDGESTETPQGRQGAVARPASPKAKVHSTALLGHLASFVRYWLSSLWFVPRQWRMNLRESYGYVPLSIRPDGGVQAGLMLLPESESEASDDESDVDDDRDGTSSERKARSTASSRQKRQSGATHLLEVPEQAPGEHSHPFRGEGAPAEVEGNIEDDDSSADGSGIDPLLAACGAHSPSSRRQSRSTAGQATESVMLGTGAAEGSDVANNKSGDDRPADQKPADPSKADGVSAARLSSRGPRRSDSTSQDHRDSRLARAIFTIWAEWLNELVCDLESLTDGIKDDNQSEEPNASLSEENGGGSSQLQSRQLKSSQLSDIGLNSRNEHDRQLVEDWTHSTVAVGAYWRFWGNWF